MFGIEMSIPSPVINVTEYMVTSGGIEWTTAILLADYYTTHMLYMAAISFASSSATALVPIAIAGGSFRHTYLFPDYAGMETPGKLEVFLTDLYSGKLQKEFHYNPDREMTSQSQVKLKVSFYFLS